MQAILRHAGQLHLLPIIRRDTRAKAVLQKIMALALLPSTRIEEAFHSIKSTTEADIASQFNSLFDYMERTWLQQITPAVFSVFNLIRRTNNAVESYHRFIIRSLHIHPNVWHFTSKF